MIAALGYLFTPMVPLVALRGDEDDPFIRKHARQALFWAVPFILLLALMIFLMIVAIQRDILFVCLSPFVFLLPFCPGAIWAKRVYFGDDVTFPFGSGAKG
jgi:uncharacterized membrane protein